MYQSQKLEVLDSMQDMSESLGMNFDLPSPTPHSVPWQQEQNIPASTYGTPSWNGVLLPPPESSDALHSSPSGPYSRIYPPHSPYSPAHPPLPQSVSSSIPNPRRLSVDSNGSVKMCSHCHATSTPLWRREPTTLKPLCNACGLYLQQRNKLRPQELIDADIDDESSDDSVGDGTGPECSHCHTHNTSVWRRSKSGAQLCNACGVYVRLRGKDRPLSLKRNKIKPRSKHTPTPPSTSAGPSITK